MNTPNQLADKLASAAENVELNEACPAYPDLLLEAATTLREQQEDNARLRGVVRYQEDRDGRIGTHAPLCYSYGRNHYECALQEIARLKAVLAQPRVPLDALIGMAECWDQTATEIAASGWHAEAGAFNVCAADVRRALKLAAAPEPKP